MVQIGMDGGTVERALVVVVVVVVVSEQK